MLAAIILGYFLGTAAAWYLAKKLLQLFADRYTHSPVQSRFMKVMGGVLGAIALAPAVADASSSRRSCLRSQRKPFEFGA